MRCPRPHVARLLVTSALFTSNFACLDARSTVVVLDESGDAREVSPTEIGVLAGLTTERDDAYASAALVVMLYTPDPAHPLRPTWGALRGIVAAVPMLASLDDVLEEMEPSVEEGLPGITEGEWGDALVLADGFALTARLDGEGTAEVELEAVPWSGADEARVVYWTTRSGHDAMLSDEPIRLTLWDVRGDEPWMLAEEWISPGVDARIAAPDDGAEHGVGAPLDVDVAAAAPRTELDDDALERAFVRIDGAARADAAGDCFIADEQEVGGTSARFALEPLLVDDVPHERCGLALRFVRAWISSPRVFAEGVVSATRTHRRAIVVVRPPVAPTVDDPTPDEEARDDDA